MLLFTHVLLITNLFDVDGLISIIPSSEYSLSIIVSLINDVFINCMKGRTNTNISCILVFKKKAIILGSTRKLGAIQTPLTLSINIQNHKWTCTGFIPKS